MTWSLIIPVYRTERLYLDFGTYGEAKNWLDIISISSSKYKYLLLHPHSTSLMVLRSCQGRDQAPSSAATSAGSQAASWPSLCCSGAQKLLLGWGPAADQLPNLSQPQHHHQSCGGCGCCCGWDQVQHPNLHSVCLNLSTSAPVNAVMRPKANIVLEVYTLIVLHEICFMEQTH